MKQTQEYYCYIMASQQNGTLYVGVTSDLIRRTYEHKSKAVDGFTKKYNANQLVWYEAHSDIETAILREKRIKKWERAWKLKLIEDFNPSWNDLYFELISDSTGLDSRFRGNDQEELTINAMY